MLRNPQFPSQSNSIERGENLSPYNNLNQSPSQRHRKPSLVIAQRLRNNAQSLNKLSNQDFTKRLEEIKKKYTSPTRNKTVFSSTTMTPVDLNIPTKKSSIGNQNISKIIEQMSKAKNIQKPFEQSLKAPLKELKTSENLNLTTNYTGSGKRKGLIDEQRISSIDKINDKIKHILDGINYKNQKFNTCVNKTTEASLEKRAPILSARPEESKQRRHLFTHQSLQKDVLPSMKRSFDEQKQEKVQPTKQFQFKLFEIQQKIKKSEQNRLKLMQNYHPRQAPSILPSTHIVDKQAGEKVKLELKQKGHVQYSHRYMDFGKNMSRNILEQLKSFNKGENVQGQLQPCQIIKNQTRRLINTFVEQVKLDEEFRNGKIWLSTNQDANKWTKLKDILSRRELKPHTQQSVKSIFKCSQDDQNPFFVSQQNQSFETLVSKYLNSEQFWNKTFLKQFSIKKLEQQGFKTELLDLELKGYLQIQDIVRYLNIQTGKFYRNRDLIFLFRRITKNNRLSFEELVKVIGY